MFVYITSKGTQ